MAAVSVSGPVPDFTKVTGPVTVLSPIAAPMVRTPAALLTTKSSAAVAPEPAVIVPLVMLWVAELVLVRIRPPEVIVSVPALRSRTCAAVVPVGAICSELTVLPPAASCTEVAELTWML